MSVSQAIRYKMIDASLLQNESSVQSMQADEEGLFVSDEEDQPKFAQTGQQSPFEAVNKPAATFGTPSPGASTSPFGQSSPFGPPSNSRLSPAASPFYPQNSNVKVCGQSWKFDIFYPEFTRTLIIVNLYSQSSSSDSQARLKFQHPYLHHQRHLHYKIQVEVRQQLLLTHLHSHQVFLQLPCPALDPRHFRHPAPMGYVKKSNPPRLLQRMVLLQLHLLTRPSQPE